MTRVVGSTTIRKGTEDYKEWTFFEEDGETAQSLEAVTKAKMRLINDATGDIMEYSTEDDPQQLYIKSPPSDGTIELRPASDDFDGEAIWRWHFILTDSYGDHPVPEDRDLTLTIIDNYPLPA